ncbi:MAG TPA: iron ABC transporter permease [Thermomicrobiales bacterium]|jgi:iron complex transport system permease protein|nr:iron ABC transporter permease [Thermomicrobiales bacterium]
MGTSLPELPTVPRGQITFRSRGLSARVNSRVLLICLGLLAVVAGLAVFAMMLGTLRIPAVDVIRTIGHLGDDQYDFVVNTLRLPRVLLAVVVGAALAVSGAIFQGLVRNPLVSPDIIGVNSGANLFVAFWLITGYSWAFVPWVAFVGAALAAVVVYGLSWRGNIAPNRLILVGIGVGEALAALTTLLFVSGTIEEVRPAQVWSIGSVYGADWGDVRLMVIALAILLPVAVAMMWPMQIMQLGEDSARSLGLGVERTRIVMLLVGCALAAFSVAVAGPIGFVALMVPHMARLIAGPLTGSVLILTALIGALFLLLADVIGQHFLPVALPVGVLTSAIGAPYFLFLLYRTTLRV